MTHFIATELDDPINIYKERITIFLLCFGGKGGRPLVRQNGAESDGCRFRNLREMRGLIWNCRCLAKTYANIM
jgi:hypothetical protein